MRTTLTLDDDLAARLSRLSRDRKVPFRRVVNDAIRRGLLSQDPLSAEPEPFEVKTFRSAFRPGIDPERLNQLLDELDARRATEQVSR
jgi:hypothetical protein